MTSTIAGFPWFRSRYCTQKKPLKDAHFFWKDVFSTHGFLFLEAPEKKTQATHIPYCTGYSKIKHPFCWSAVFFGGVSTAFERNEPWYMILLANMVLIAVKLKALTAGDWRNGGFAVYMIYHKAVLDGWITTVTRFGGIQQWYVLNDFTLVRWYMVVGYVIMTLVQVMLRDAVGYARSVENNFTTQTRSTSWYKLTWRASELVQVW